MSYNSFAPKVFEVFLFGGSAAAIFATTCHLIKKAHRLCDEVNENSVALFNHSRKIMELIKRVEKCEGDKKITI